ncbi:MAG: sterol desaturase family protein [Planctomycetota bacterium]|jgi:sterol desaturase/sphingolipid hydroxylase (fatty acid hydroxylase superfamily)|nr:sterol desaturase family protein [Planctomycetota bacterium]
MKHVRAAITYALFPVTFFGALWGALVGIQLELSKWLVLAGITASSAVVVAVCERIHPVHRGWNRSRSDVGTDATHALVSMILLPYFLEMILATSLLVVAIQLADVVGFALWPNQWNLLAQLVLAMLISQFGEYWVHRMMHECPLFWRFHATHHSPGRLYWLNAARFHPIDTAIGHVSALAPILILGAGSEVLLLVSVWVMVHGMFQHCNIHLRLGPLNYVFSMAELHRWHHSRKVSEANANYGNNIIFWDIVFGTRYHPPDREASSVVGLADLDRFPQDYVGQILSPFRWNKITGEGEPAMGSSSREDDPAANGG